MGKKTCLMSVPVEPDLKVCIEQAARLEDRKPAAYIRTTILRDLQSKGLVDDQLQPKLGIVTV